MNYFITCPPRSGSSYLGSLIQLQGLPYFNELFTPEICRRRHIWPRHLDEKLNRDVVDRVTEVPGAGFKMPYNISQPGVLAEIQRRPYFHIIHIIRDDLLEQLASWRYLQEFGISMAKDNGTLWNTDGQKVETIPDRPRVVITHEDALEHFESMDRLRWASWWMFHDTHQYLEVHMAEIFTRAGQRNILGFLGKRLIENRHPDHAPTPRPPARELISNYDDLRQAFTGTKWEGLFEARPEPTGGTTDETPAVSDI